jgi:hypothetical protein
MSSGGPPDRDALAAAATAATRPAGAPSERAQAAAVNARRARVQARERAEAAADQFELRARELRTGRVSEEQVLAAARERERARLLAEAWDKSVAATNEGLLLHR